MAIENAYQDAEGNWKPYTGSMKNVRIPDDSEIVMDDPLTRIVASRFRRTNRKIYENYVITGVWHRLRAKGILLEPITQQYVKRSGGYALLDLYFPALNMSVECDEKHHLRQTEADRERTRDIIAASDMDPLRSISAIPGEEKTFRELRVVCAEERNDASGRTKTVFRKLAEIDAGIECAVAEIEKRWKSLGSPAWDARTPSEKLLDTGCLRVKDRWVFRSHKEVYSGFHLQKPKDQHAAKKIPGRDDIEICHQELTVPGVREGEWKNVLSEDGKTIVEHQPKGGLDKREENGWRRLKRRLEGREPFHRIIFGKTKDFFGSSGYVFLGEFELAEANLDAPAKNLVWKRVKDVVAIKDVTTPPVECLAGR